jgi:hypothetical protein
MLSRVDEHHNLDIVDHMSLRKEREGDISEHILYIVGHSQQLDLTLLAWKPSVGVNNCSNCKEL